MDKINIYSLFVVFFLQCLGAWEHWRFIKNEGRVSGSFREYLLSSYPGRSYATLFAIAGSSWMSAMSGMADYLNPELLYALVQHGEIDIKLATAISGAVMASVGVGYALDSRFNKGGQTLDDSAKSQ